MIYKMIAGDILTFASIYVILLFGFSLAFYYLYKNVGEGIETMKDYLEALMISFQMTLGEFKVNKKKHLNLFWLIFLTKKNIFFLKARVSFRIRKFKKF